MYLRVTDEAGQFTISGDAVARLQIKLADCCVECFGIIAPPGDAPLEF